MSLYDTGMKTIVEIVVIFSTENITYKIFWWYKLFFFIFWNQKLLLIKRGYKTEEN